MSGVFRRLLSLRRERLLAAVGVLAAVVAGVLFGVIESIGGTAVVDPALVRAASLGQVVAQVRRGFGDRQIAAASLDGSVLNVTLDFRGTRTTPGYGVRGVFEARVLGAAVAEWMRAHGQKPITSLRYRNEGKIIPGWPQNGDPVESDPPVSSLPADACAKAAKAAREASLKLVSARTLPYLKGTCIFTFKAAHLQAGAEAAGSAVQRIIPAIGGPPDQRPWLFELDDRHGIARTGASWMPHAGGTTWTTPGLAYPLAHE